PRRDCGGVQFLRTDDHRVHLGRPAPRAVTAEGDLPGGVGPHVQVVRFLLPRFGNHQSLARRLEAAFRHPRRRLAIVGNVDERLSLQLEGQKAAVSGDRLVPVGGADENLPSYEVRHTLIGIGAIDIRALPPTEIAYRYIPTPRGSMDVAQQV